MIIQIFYDIRIFLILLILSLFAFGDTFLKISNANANENQVVENFLFSVIYSYSMILGEYDTGEFGDIGLGVMYAFWILCTIFNMIIMLNLIIALISATYEKVESN